MAKLLRSFRSQMIGLLGLSMLLAFACTFFVYKLLQLYYSGVKLGEPAAKLRRYLTYIGDLNFFLIVFIPLSILFFFFLTKRYANYFQEISTGIHRLAGGDFHNRILIDSNDEFKDIADDINMASEKLQQAVERGDFAENSKDQLVLNLAHDLRTPLTSVIGYLDIILKDEKLQREQMIHYTTIAYNKSQRLEKLIDELFEITRMKYGMIKLEKTLIDLSELLEQLNEELFPVFEKSNLLSRLYLAPHLEIMGDGELLARVFENLLTNANRYGKDGQFIDIHARLDEGEAVVQVINYGNCIPENELPHLFEMFYTGDQARTQQGGRTGLGLFIAKNIVEQHLGTITVQSNVIRTIFEVRLPVPSHI